MFVLGLTGGIAMGKSTAAGSFRSFGVPVFDADAAVHDLFAPGGAAVAPVSAAFPGCLSPAGGIDRRSLGALVFDHPDRLARLEAIVHPIVEAAQRRFVAHCAAVGRRLIVLDIPLLYETGAERRVDAVAVVSAPVFLQTQRVLRRGVTPERLAAIRARQMADADKRRRADFVVRTGIDRRYSIAAIAAILDHVRGRRGRAWPTRWRSV